MKHPRRALALALGLGVGSVLVGIAEVWQRSREAGPVQLVHDPPGLKYALAEWEPDRSRGWHEGRDIPARSPDTIRILAVGDSITYGVHVSPRETWPARLDDLLEPLAEQRSSKLEISNFGVNGYDAEQVASLVTHRLTPWKPDLVIWAAYVNDQHPTYLLHGSRSGDPIYVGTDVPESIRLLPRTLSVWAIGHSALFRRLQGAHYSRMVANGVGTTPEPSWFEEQTRAMSTWSHEQDIPLLVLALAPHVLADPSRCSTQFHDPTLCETSLQQYEQMTAVFDALELDWIDGLAAYQRSGAAHFHPPDRRDPDHPSAEGHNLLARTLLPRVREILRWPDHPASDEPDPPSPPSAQ